MEGKVERREEQQKRWKESSSWAEIQVAGRHEEESPADKQRPVEQEMAIIVCVS